MSKLRSTFIRRILGRKSQRIVDGQVTDITDRDGNVKQFWTLVWEYLRDNDVVERKVNIFPNQLSGGRDGESMLRSTSSPTSCPVVGMASRCSGLVRT